MYTFLARESFKYGLLYSGIHAPTRGPLTDFVMSVYGPQKCKQMCTEKALHNHVFYLFCKDYQISFHTAKMDPLDMSKYIVRECAQSDYVLIKSPQ